ncbi:MAG: 50S ribosomal protein L32 [Anaerolineae bacterium]|nr:50S ribosomal protein L32 [Anaerolineae bacterium]
MGPLPKRKVSKTRRNKRRAHDHLSLQHLVVCDDCGEYKPAHQVCPACGSYNGREVLPIDEDEE